MSTSALHMNTLDYALGNNINVASYKNTDTKKFVKLNYSVVDAEFILSHGTDGRSVRSAVYEHIEKADVIKAYNELLEKII